MSCWLETTGLERVHIDFIPTYVAVLRQTLINNAEKADDSRW